MHTQTTTEPIEGREQAKKRSNDGEMNSVFFHRNENGRLKI